MVAMGIYVLKEAISRARLQEIAKERFGDLVKGVVDTEQRILAVGAELHVDAAVELQEKENSKSEQLWSINLYPAETGEAFMEFDSMINLKPALGNRTREVDDAVTRERIKAIVRNIVEDSGL